MWIKLLYGINRYDIGGKYTKISTQHSQGILPSMRDLFGGVWISSELFRLTLWGEQYLCGGKTYAKSNNVYYGGSGGIRALGIRIAGIA